MRGAKCDSDHCMVLARARMNLKSRTTETQTRRSINMNNVKNRETVQRFQEAMVAKMEEMNQQPGTVSEHWYRVSKSLVHADLDKFGEEITRGPGWFDDECLEVAGEARRARGRWLNTLMLSDEEQMREARRAVNEQF